MNVKLTKRAAGNIEENIHSIRGLRVILDRDLAEVWTPA